MLLLLLLRVPAGCPLQFRFMLLALAGLEAPLQLPLGEKGLYGQDCVFIANDWHAALVPVYLAAKYRPYGVYTNARSIMAIHNLRHQVGGAWWALADTASAVWLDCSSRLPSSHSSHSFSSMTGLQQRASRFENCS